jgi:iron complex outermembrane receptor protein
MVGVALPISGTILQVIPYTLVQVQKGSLKGLEFSLGLFYQGEREADLANTFQLPSYLRTDAAIFYEGDRFRAALNFRNLFDVEYYESAFLRC